MTPPSPIRPNPDGTIPVQLTIMSPERRAEARRLASTAFTDREPVAHFLPSSHGLGEITRGGSGPRDRAGSHSARPAGSPREFVVDRVHTLITEARNHVGSGNFDNRVLHRDERADSEYTQATAILDRAERLARRNGMREALAEIRSLRDEIMVRRIGLDTI